MTAAVTNSTSHSESASTSSSTKTLTPEGAKIIFLNELRTLVPVLVNHRNTFNNLLSSLEQTSRSDVTFHGVETTKVVLDEMKMVTENLKKLHKLMKSRAQARKQMASFFKKPKTIVLCLKEHSMYHGWFCALPFNHDGWCSCAVREAFTVRK